jgi:hypothetical protein
VDAGAFFQYFILEKVQLKIFAEKTHNYTRKNMNLISFSQKFHENG